MRKKESREMYLEAIYKLELTGAAVRSVDIAGELGVSKPSVSRAMGVLKEAGHITHSHYGDIALTTAGRAKAERIYHTHKTITGFLMKTLCLCEEDAEADACRIEHVISDKALAAIERLLSE